MEDVNFEVSAKNLLLESGTELDTDISQRNRSKIIAQKKAQASQCFQSLDEFNASVESLSEDNWCSQIIETDSDDTLFASCKLNLSLTPPRTIAEQILHDFCSSPLSPSSAALEERLKMQQFYGSPCFKFRHKNVRVYHNKKRRKLFENQMPEEKEEQEKEMCVCDDDDCMSISSGLSVQEDLTQTEIECENNHTSVLNKSQNIYENLLNLSAYFTQQTADHLVKSESSPTNIDIVEETLDRQQIAYESPTTISNEGVSRTWLSETESDSMSDTSECLQTQKPSKVATSCKVIAEETPLFSDDEGDQYFINFNSQDILESRKKVVNTTNIETGFPCKFDGFQTAGKNTIKVSDAARERANKLIADVIDLVPNTEVESDVKINFGGFQTAGNKTIKISEESKSRASKLIADVLEIEPNTGAEIGVNPKEMETNFGGFQTAGNKAIKISEASKSRASKLIADVLEIEPNTGAEKDMNSKEIGTNFGGFQTAGNKTIKISEELKSKASKLIADVLELEPNTGVEKDMNSKETETNFGGFQTARNKAIKISEASKSRASKLIADVIELKPVPNQSPEKMFEGFKTAGSKTIKISEESKNRASKLIADVMDMPSAENEILNAEKEIITEGFQTAGSKTIKISEESKNRASKLIADVLEENLEMSDEKEEDFKGFPEETNPNSRLLSENMQNDVMKEFADIQFSEWPHVEEVITSQPKDDIPEPPLPMLDITDSKSNTSLSITNLSRDGNGKFISRKNLLSLSNRRKRTNTKDNNSLKTKVNDKHNLNVTPKDKMPESDEPFSTPGSHKPLSELPVSSTPTSNTKALDLVLEGKRNSSSKKTPTPKERIEYLRRYGEPPDLSPIPNLTPKGVDNCRPSGLRRNIKK